MSTPGPQAEAAWPDIQPDAYVTEIWCPPVDNGIQKLHLPMRAPEPIPEPEPELEAGL
jgi:hypothetical protein